jgi:SAM-dependent methyltransferase
MTTQTIDEAKLEEFMGKVVGDMGAAASVALNYVGEQLGLYQALSSGGKLTAGQLAARTGTNERMVREWANAQAASGYLTYDPASEAYELPAEHAFALADVDSPVFLGGAWHVLAAMWADADKLASSFKTGKGLGWDERDSRLFLGTERFFRPGYRASLTTEWLPALEGVVEKLEQGGKVADIGCGHGASTIVMAEAYPNSALYGFDYHGASIDTANERAREAGLSDRITFKRASAKDYPGNDYDLICFFDCLHDMGDPVGAAKHARQALKPDGTVLLVEPMAADRTEDNFNPVGRLFYSASTMICTPASQAQEVGLALGAQAGEGRLREVFREAGFSTLRRAAETPFNVVLEAKP